MRINYYRLFCITAVLFIGIPALLLAQEKEAQEQHLEYGASTSAYVSTGSAGLPFWLYANTDGRVDGQSSNFITQFYSHYRSNVGNSPFRFESGINISSRFSADNSLFFDELYTSVGWRSLNLKIGRFYNPIGIYDQDLTMGAMTASRNATPVPKIQLATDGYMNIPYTNDHLQFKAMMSHGWLEGNRHVENPFLHQKYLYLKINYGRFEVIGGLIHNVMWGGTSPKYGKLPSSFSDFLRVFSGSSASPDGTAPPGEVKNAIGNTVAAYNTGVNVDFENFKIKAYRSFYLEDRVAAQFRSPWDGIWGLNFAFDKTGGLVDEVLWEHMNTKRQDGFDYEPWGMSSDYNHFIYKSGWSYENKVLGNPLILYGSNDNFVSDRKISNNIIVAHHIGIKGQVSERLRYKSMFTYSRNYGTRADQTQKNGFENPEPLGKFRVDEYSAFLKGNYKLLPAAGLSMTAAIAFDIGDLYKNERFGFQIGLRLDRLAN